MNKVKSDKANGSEPSTEPSTLTEVKKMKVFGSADIKKTIIRSMEVMIDGEPGVIYFKSVPGRLILNLSEGDLSNANGITKMASRLSESLVNPDGSQLMTVDELIDTPLETLSYLMERMGEETGKGKVDKQGEDLSGGVSSAQSTN